jgi:hypothetical protein
MNHATLKISLALAFATQAAVASAASPLTTWLTNGATSSEAGAVTFDFGASAATDNTKAVVTGYSATSGIASYSGGDLFNLSVAGISGKAARPVGSTGNFWTIGAGETGTVTFSGQGVSYYGFLWGSPDIANWNDVTFYNGATVLGHFDGTVTKLNNAWPNSIFFNVSTGNGPAITSIKFTANQPAFEMDNHAMIAAVPEPETYAMMVAGLALMGGIARRRKSA